MFSAYQHGSSAKFCRLTTTPDIRLTKASIRTLHSQAVPLPQVPDPLLHTTTAVCTDVLPAVTCEKHNLQRRADEHCNFQEVIFIVSGNSHSRIIYKVYLKYILMLKLIVMLI